MSFMGELNPATFDDFVRHRATRLDLEARIEASSAQQLDVEVSGPPDLVDAFEMACSLGPIDCLVLDYRRSDQGNNSPADKEDLQ